MKGSTGLAVVQGLLVAALMVGLLGCSSARTDLSQFEREGSEIRIYEVFGMDCPGCHGGLEKLVNEIPAVRTSKANWEKQQLKVAFHPNAEVDDNAIYTAIKQANFTPGKRLE